MPRPPRRKTRRRSPRADLPAVPEGPPTRDALAALGADRLADLLLLWARTDDELEERLRRELAAATGGIAGRVRGLRQEIRRSTRSAPRQGILSWRAAVSRTNRAERILEEVLEHVLPADPAAALGLVDDLLLLERNLRSWVTDHGVLAVLSSRLREAWCAARVAAERSGPPRPRTIPATPEDPPRARRSRPPLEDTPDETAPRNDTGPRTRLLVDEIAARIAADDPWSWSLPLRHDVPGILGRETSRLVAARLLELGALEVAADLAEGIPDPELLERALVEREVKLAARLEAIRRRGSRGRDDDGKEADAARDPAPPRPGTREARAILRADARESLARAWAATGHPEEALAVLESGEPGQHLEARAELLEELGRPAEALDLRWRLFADGLSPGAWEELLARLPEEEREAARDRARRLAVAHPRPGLAVRFLLEIGAAAEAEALALGIAPREFGELGEGEKTELAERAVEAGHSVLATLLLRENVRSVLDAGDTRRYAAGAAWLRRLGELARETPLPGGIPSHQRFVTDLRARHGRKRSFWKRVDDPSTR